MNFFFFGLSRFETADFIIVILVMYLNDQCETYFCKIVRTVLRNKAFITINGTKITTDELMNFYGYKNNCESIQTMFQS